MIKSTELCPKCNHIAAYNSYFNKHMCCSNDCDFHALIANKNENYIESLANNCFNVNILKNKINEIIVVLNKITNPDMNDNDIV